jgi:hypothetical protein
MFPKMFGRNGHSTPHAKSESLKHKPKKPTLKQEKFVEGVIQHGNATRAARDAGYSPRSASVIASRTLKRADIQEQIKSRIEAAKLDTDEIIGTLIGHMRADIGNLLGDDGALDLVRALENGSTHIIKKLTIRTRRIAGTKGGSPTVREGVATNPASNLTTTECSRDDQPIEETTYEIVLHDAQSAARHLARILHLEVKNRPIEARRPTDDELAHRMADLLERARAAGRREGAATQRTTQTMESHSEDLETAGQNKQSAVAEREMPPASLTPRREPESSRWPLQNHHTELEMSRGLSAARVQAKPHVGGFEKLSGSPSEPPTREVLPKTQSRSGLWNRVFSSAQTLTFINPFRVPSRSYTVGTADVFGQVLTREPSLFGLLRFRSNDKPETSSAFS